MDYAYQPTAWHDFYVCIGTAAAALIGLIFVGLSLHLKPVAHHPGWRGRAKGSVISLFALLVVAGIVLMPGQSRGLLGVELLLWGAGLTAIEVVSIWRASRFEPPPGDALATLVASNTGLLCLLFSGISLLLGRLGGLFWLPVFCLLFFGAAIFNAWQLVWVAAEEAEEASEATT